VDTDSTQFVISYTASKFKTYLLMRPVRSIVEGQYFSDTDNWQPSTKYAGFEIAAFNGYKSSGSTPVLCAAFARFSGNPGNYEFDAGVGYKNLADGIYCAFSGQAALINPIDNLYRAAEDALAKVTFPGDHDYSEELRSTRALADKGDAPAQNRVGFMYENGLGVSQDYAEAARWYRKAADQGLATAQLQLGSMYAKGQGLSQDYVQALKWYTLAVNRFPISDANHKLAVDACNTVAANMSPDQVMEAEGLVSEWSPTTGD
jgi:hypothetical protein